MRTAEEILNQFYNVDEGFTGYEKECFLKAINEARKECIEECAKMATVKQELITPHQSIVNIGEGTSTATQKSAELIHLVDKQSILSLIKELK